MLLGLLFAAEPRSSEAQAQGDAPERWSFAAGMAVGPLEPFPRFGMSLAAHYRWRWLRIGGVVGHYPGATRGNVTRSATFVAAQSQFFVIDSRWVDWSFDLGIGVASFRDDYLQVYDDVSRVAPGFSLGSTVEVRASRLLRPFVGVQTHAYFGKDIADDKWLELTTGLRFSF